jgi:hypothetical protein
MGQVKRYPILPRRSLCKILTILAFFVFFALLPAPSNASSCWERVLEVIEKTSYRPARQCVNTCYLEPAVSSLERELSREEGAPVFVSRLYSFAQLLGVRTEAFFSTESAARKGEIEAGYLGEKTSNHGYVDVLSGGSVELMVRLFQQGIVLTQPKSQADYYRESRQMRELAQEVFSLLYNYQQVSRQKDSGAKAAELERIKTEVNARIDNALQMSKTQRGNFFLDKDLDSVSIKNLVFRINDTSGKEVRTSFHWEQMKKAKKDNHELIVIYEHKDNHEKNGLLDVARDAPARNLPPPGEAKDLHAIALHDFILGPNGVPEFFILRTNWGTTGGGFPGIVVMSRAYFERYVHVVKYVSYQPD